jgi:hypothetical protein
VVLLMNDRATAGVGKIPLAKINISAMIAQRET